MDRTGLFCDRSIHHYDPLINRLVDAMVLTQKQLLDCFDDLLGEFARVERCMTDTVQMVHGDDRSRLLHFVNCRVAELKSDAQSAKDQVAEIPIW